MRLDIGVHAHSLGNWGDRSISVAISLFMVGYAFGLFSVAFDAAASRNGSKKRDADGASELRTGAQSEGQFRAQQPRAAMKGT